MYVNYGGITKVLRNLCQLACMYFDPIELTSGSLRSQLWNIPEGSCVGRHMYNAWCHDHMYSGHDHTSSLTNMLLGMQALQWPLHVGTVIVKTEACIYTPTSYYIACLHEVDGWEEHLP